MAKHPVQVMTTVQLLYEALTLHEKIVKQSTHGRYVAAKWLRERDEAIHELLNRASDKATDDERNRLINFLNS